ncbi:MAG TPA: hypothetical protein VGJ86_01785 [Acidimicrobiales bacterium]
MTDAVGSADPIAVTETVEPTTERPIVEAPAEEATTSATVATDDGAARPRLGSRAAATVRGWWNRRVGQTVVLLLPSMLLVERAWDRRWMTDDGFINLRVARMILEGHGPVFNDGERIEVTTSALWVWILALGDVVLPLRMEWVAVVLGITFSVGGMVLVTLGASRLHRTLGASGLLVPAGACVLAVLSPIWDFSSSGLEGGLTFGWLGLTMFLLARWAGSDARFGTRAAMVVSLGPLVRPDMTLVWLAVAAGILVGQWRGDRWTSRLRFLAAVAAIPVGYEILRMGFYASLVPNTALAKSAGQTRWDEGWAYMRDFVQPYALFLPVLVLLAAVLVPAIRRAWGSRQRRGVVALAVLPLAGIVDAVYITRVGGDYMHGRLLLPALYCLLAPVAAVPVPRLVLPRRRSVQVAGWAVVATVVWAVVCLSWLRPTEESAVDGVFASDARQGSVRLYGDHAVTTDDQNWGRSKPWTRLDRRYKVYVIGNPYFGKPPALPPPVYAGWGIGIAGYALGPDVYMLDMLGLGDPVVARFELDEPGPVGHEKPMPRPWLAAVITNAPLELDDLPDPEMSPPLYESNARDFRDDVQAARTALSCSKLKELTAAVRKPMSLQRFWDNIRLAPSLTRLQVPPDPNEAVERFCDAD